MSDSTGPRRRKTSKNTFTTKSGKTIKVNRSLGDRVKASKEAKAQRKAAYLSTLPKERWKRLLYRLHPKRLYKYWFSRDGAIMALKIAGIGVVVVFLLIVGLFAYFRKDLPKIQDINGGNAGGSIAYYDRTGKTLLFQDYDTFKRIPVENLKDISPYMYQATIAVEDKDFYHEGAFNVRGVTRAAINNLKGGSTQGGSTITQQLVKMNEGWASERTVGNKVKELILAVELEREYSKDDILTAYLNIAPYSGLDYGVEAAAQDMFGVHAKDLTLEQSAMLAAIPKSPGALSPYASPTYNSYATADLFNKQALLDRQHYILDLMAEQHYITQKQADAAKKVDIIAQVKPRPTNHYAGLQYPWFYQAASKELQKIFPASVIKAGGWKVITTMDVGLQDLADKAVSDGARQLRNQHADNAAFVAEDNATGQVLAVVGGTDFANQQTNFAVTAKISPGSSIKPYSYAALINDNNNVGAGSVLYDTQGALPGYPCTNKAQPAANGKGGNCLWDDTRHYSGAVTLRYALGSSLNVPAVKAFTSTDPKDTSALSDRTASINNTMSTVRGLMDDSHGYECYYDGTDLLEATTDDEKQCGAAAGIGDGAYLTLADHVNGIASIARMGQAIPQTFILKVTNSSGKVLKQFQQPKPKQVIKPDAAYIVSDMAADGGASYLGGSCNSTNCYGMKFHRYKGWHNAIKTGTTNDQTDGLMMSWNSKFTAGIWVGNYDRSSYIGQPENMTDPIMKEFMQGAIDSLGNVKPTNWTAPNDLKTLPAYRSAVPFRTESSPPSTDLFPSWYVGKVTTGPVQTIDKVSGLAATSCTPAAAKQTLGGGGSANALNVDIYAGGHPDTTSSTKSSTKTTTATDNVHSCSDAPPSVTITAVNGVSTGSGASLSCTVGVPCDIRVHVEQGTHDLTSSQYPNYPGTITLTVDGQQVQQGGVSASGDLDLTYTPPAGTSGSVTINVSVTDSVLYEGSDSTSLTVVSATTNNPNSNDQDNGPQAYRWPTTSGPGPKGVTTATITRLSSKHR